MGEYKYFVTVKGLLPEFLVVDETDLAEFIRAFSEFDYRREFTVRKNPNTYPL